MFSHVGINVSLVKYKTARVPLPAISTNLITFTHIKCGVVFFFSITLFSFCIYTCIWPLSLAKFHGGEEKQLSRSFCTMSSINGVNRETECDTAPYSERTSHRNAIHVVLWFLCTHFCWCCFCVILKTTCTRLSLKATKNRISCRSNHTITVIFICTWHHKKTK